VTSSTAPGQRLLAFRATRALTLGVIAMGAAAWLISLPGVAIGLACGAVPALLIPRSRTLVAPIVATFATAVTGACAGSLLLGHGSVTMRLLGGLVTSCAVAPWLVVLGFTLRVRSRR